VLQIWPSAGTLLYCSFVIIIISVNQTPESKFIYLNRCIDKNQATYVGRQYFMSSVAIQESVEVLPFALIRLYYILYQPECPKH